MKFVQQEYSLGETIAAIATPPGEGGVAIIRISGEESLAIAAKIFSGPVHTYPSHTAHFGYIRNTYGERVDEVLVLVMKGNRSYTGESTVEIHCHGGSLITRRVLETVLAAGARAALPGEFTFRAFYNGKMDLAQAEAVQALIGAKNEKALDIAEQHLQGSLSKKITHFQKKLTHICAILEAWVDFPEEGLEFATIEEILDQLEKIQTEMKCLSSSFYNGKIIHEGISLALIGRPNVGKSSLMNALLDKERAIVSATPGTTRDVLEDHIRLYGIHIKLSDTAGIREAIEEVEQEGIRRSKIALEESDIILLVLDAHAGFTQEDQELLASMPREKTIAVWNKIDLPHELLPSISVRATVSLSAKKQQGIDKVHAAIQEALWTSGSLTKEEIVITHIRHKEALDNAIGAIEVVQNGLKQGTSPEFLTFDLRQSLQELGKIIGTDVTDDILSAIFSKFCIGK